MKKIKPHRKRKFNSQFTIRLFLTFSLSILLFYSCQEKDSVEQINELPDSLEHKHDFGISKQSFINSNISKEIVLKLNDANKSVFNKSIGDLTIEELAERLDLENAYYSNENSVEILNVPVKTLGNYRRELLFKNYEGKTISYLLTYPNPQDKKLFFLSDLNGNLIQKVTIQNDGIGLVERFDSKKATSSKSRISSKAECERTIYISCSSGGHNHLYGNADECDYWDGQGDGVPPSSFTTIDEDCLERLNGGSGGGGDGNGDDISTLPPGDGTGGSPAGITNEDCVVNLDCEDCNLEGDLNNDCSVTFEESKFYNFISSLTRDQKSALESDSHLYERILIFLTQNQFSSTAEIFSADLLDLLKLESSIDFNALNFTLQAFNQNKIYAPFNSSFLNSVNECIDINTSVSNPGLIQLQLYFNTRCAVLKLNNPNWSDEKILWEASKDFVHIALDGFGMIPVVGEIADLTNGVLYLIEGDGVNASLSFAATLPVVGWGATTGKYVFKIIPSTIGTKVRLTWKVLNNGIVYFGSSGSKLRKVLGITDSALHAHHLIPWARREHDLVQKAAKSGDAFHINEAMNGIPRPSNLHLTGHSAYNTKIKQILDNLYDDAMTVDEAYDELFDFVDYLRDLITNNPTLNSGQIADLISYP